MADTLLNNMITQQAWARAVILGDEAARAEQKYAELEQIVNVVDGVSGALNASLLPLIPAAEPAAMSERLDTVPLSRMQELSPITAAYVRYIKKLIFRDLEFEALVNSGAWQQLPQRCFNAIYGHLRGAVETKLKGANASGTLAVPNYAGSTEAFAANHTLASGTYQNYAVLALSLANCKTAMTSFAGEKDMSGQYTNRMARFLVASDFGALYQAVRSPQLSSAGDANPGELLSFILMPGMSNTWALSSGPTPGGLTLEFRKPLSESFSGRPYVKPPYFDTDGRVVLQYGCDYAILAGSWEGLYLGDPDW